MAELDIEEKAYDMFFSPVTPWPCLSFDFIHSKSDHNHNILEKPRNSNNEKKGSHRTTLTYPLQINCIAGTQAAQANLNEIYVIRWDNLNTLKENNGYATDSSVESDSDENEKGRDAEKLRKESASGMSDAEKLRKESASGMSDAEKQRDPPLIQVGKNKERVICKAIRHKYGGINRIKTCKKINSLIASWCDDSNVYIYEISDEMRNLEEQPYNEEVTKPPVHIFQKHTNEGFSLDWNPIHAAKLLTGDNDGNLFLWIPDNCEKWIYEHINFEGTHVSSHHNEGPIGSSKDGIDNDRCRDGIDNDRCRDGIDNDRSKDRIDNDRCRDGIDNDRCRDGIDNDKCRDGIDNDRCRDGIDNDKCRDGIDNDRCRDGIEKGSNSSSRGKSKGDKREKAKKYSIEDVQWNKKGNGLGNVFAMCSSDKSVRILDVRNLKSYGNKKHVNNNSCEIYIPDAHESDVNVIAWNENLEFLLASGGDDSIVKIWDIRNFANSVAQLKFHKQPISSVSWHFNDPYVLLASSADNSISIWDLSVETESLEHSLSKYPDQLLFEHLNQNFITDAKFHPHYPGVVVSTSSDNFNIFKPCNIS
ncbi:WD domain, G-beta repeat domain containing protein [Plasmodium gonderi]|uniref:WD domain, G-beta repeat domain containing protein n=1 Tax=Plasmodium gonderi TaxID=77519 RepID=A0A1Y1JEV4_PLAGO|nr:WD domain, G-beta repeat domain containing protein [Plasmodium gonderi]GAW79747.1 WD domain, G-beta repeat domain containing protein [Plasmodium gonderi]